MEEDIVDAFGLSNAARLRIERLKKQEKELGHNTTKAV
jgi:hypothetical protein